MRYLVTLLLICSPLSAQEPWLPEAEQARIREMLPKGVPVPDGLKFYSLPQVYQSLVSMNGGVPYRDILPVSDEKKPWTVSGGMTHVNRATWRSYKGLALTGPIEWWEETISTHDPKTGENSFPTLRKIYWRFPEGTQAYDVLVRVAGGWDQNVFEVRVQEKLADKWDDGTTYRPDVPVTGARKDKYTWQFPESEPYIEAAATEYVVAAIPEGITFSAKRTLAIDEDNSFVPKDYHGAGVSCNGCHSKKVERVGNVEMLGYGKGQRVMDGRFSWNIFNRRGGIETRWPLLRR